jgi:hypothetical protein
MRLRRSSVSGEIIPRCHCGKCVYAEGLCYSCFQTGMALVLGAPNSYEDRLYRLRRERLRNDNTPTVA